jgi:hypothetical protein
MSYFDFRLHVFDLLARMIATRKSNNNTAVTGINIWSSKLASMSVMSVVVKGVGFVYKK